MRPTCTELERYREQGYLIVEELYTPEECDALCRHARDVVEGRVPLASGDRVWMEPAAEEQGLVDETNRGDYLFKIGHQIELWCNKKGMMRWPD